MIAALIGVRSRLKDRDHEMTTTLALCDQLSSRPQHGQLLHRGVDCAIGLTSEADRQHDFISARSWRCARRRRGFGRRIATRRVYWDSAPERAKVSASWANSTETMRMSVMCVRTPDQKHAVFVFGQYLVGPPEEQVRLQGSRFRSLPVVRSRGREASRGTIGRSSAPAAHQCGCFARHGAA
jgi:hypothetical protein